jgi:hypothetical protein
VIFVDELDRHRRRDHRQWHPPHRAAEQADKRRERSRDNILGADGIGSEHDRRAQEVDAEPEVAGGVLLEQPLDLFSWA